MTRRARAAALVLLVAFGTASGIALTEIALRVAGWQYRGFPLVQFGWPSPSRMAELYMADRELFWVPKDYAARVDRARAASPTIVFLGDSCTEFSHYPEMTVELLQDQLPGRVTGLKMAVGGWSSEQGLRQLRRDIVPLRPRILTIYFGWNDHWVAFGPPDPDIVPSAATWWLAQHFRVVQALHWTRIAVGRRLAAPRNRVSLQRYDENLRAMAAIALDAGAVPVFITAGSSHRRGAEPAYLAKRHLARLEDLVPLHSAYTAATREASRVSGAVLCDAAAMFEGLGPARDRAFREDQIHLSRDGDRLMAAFLADCVARSVPAFTSGRDRHAVLLVSRFADIPSPADYLSTVPARVMSAGGMVRPRASAVLRFTAR